MSDRRMRLKYLTKMKIILCIFLLYITAVSVFGLSQELNGIVGKSIEFPAAVETGGSLVNSSKGVIGYVSSGAFIRLTDPQYKDRVHWDSSTGYFSLSELRLKDSGVYNVQNTVNNTNGKTSVSFHLTVWKDNVPVSKPHLSVTRNEYRCTVLCAAARGTGVTLTLYREGEKNPYVTSPVHSHPDLNMTVPVESGTYTCETKNSVSRQTSDPLTVGAHCTAPSSPSTGEIFASVIAAILIVALIAVFIYLLYWPSARSSTEECYAAVIAAVLIVALIADLIYFLCSTSARSSTGTIVLVAFVILALIAVFISLLYSCGTSRKLEDTENELEDTKSKLKGLRGRAKRNEKPKTKKGCAIS